MRLSEPKKADNDEEDTVQNGYLITEGLELANKLGNNFLSYDPNDELSRKFEHNLSFYY